MLKREITPGELLEMLFQWRLDKALEKHKRKTHLLKVLKKKKKRVDKLSWL